MDGTEGDETHEVFEELVVACRDASEVLEFVEEALDKIALFVEVPVTSMRSAAVRPGRDDGDGPSFEDGVVEMLGIICLVGNDRATGVPFDQRCAVEDFTAMARTCDEADRIAKAVRCCVEFGPEPALGAAKTLGIRPPFCRGAPLACWWARMIVASTHSHSKSLSWLNALNRLMNTPRLTQS